MAEWEVRSGPEKGRPRGPRPLAVLACVGALAAVSWPVAALAKNGGGGHGKKGGGGAAQASPSPTGGGQGAGRSRGGRSASGHDSSAPGHAKHDHSGRGHSGRGTPERGGGRSGGHHGDGDRGAPPSGVRRGGGGHERQGPKRPKKAKKAKRKRSVPSSGTTPPVPPGSPGAAPISAGPGVSAPVVAVPMPGSRELPASSLPAPGPGSPLPVPPVPTDTLPDGVIPTELAPPDRIPSGVLPPSAPLGGQVIRGTIALGDEGAPAQRADDRDGRRRASVAGGLPGAGDASGVTGVARDVASDAVEVVPTYMWAATSTLLALSLLLAAPTWLLAGRARQVGRQAGSRTAGASAVTAPLPADTAPVVAPLPTRAPRDPLPLPATASPGTLVDDVAQLNVGPFPNIDAVNHFVERLSTLSFVDDIQVGHFEGNRVLVDVALAEPTEVARELRQAFSPAVVVTQPGARDLVVEIASHGRPV